MRGDYSLVPGCIEICHLCWLHPGHSCRCSCFGHVQCIVLLTCTQQQKHSQSFPGLLPVSVGPVSMEAKFLQAQSPLGSASAKQSHWLMHCAEHCSSTRQMKHLKVLHLRFQMLGRYVEERAARTPGKRSLAMEAFARALRAIPSIICDNAGACPLDSVTTQWLSIQASVVATVRHSCLECIQPAGSLKCHAGDMYSCYLEVAAGRQTTSQMQMVVHFRHPW